MIAMIPLGPPEGHPEVTMTANGLTNRHRFPCHPERQRGILHALRVAGLATMTIHKSLAAARNDIS